MNELMKAILDHATTELHKDRNKELIAQKARERAQRDQEIAMKARAENTLSTADSSDA